jgi:hypothetical protein
MMKNYQIANQYTDHLMWKISWMKWIMSKSHYEIWQSNSNNVMMKPLNYEKDLQMHHYKPRNNAQIHITPNHIWIHNQTLKASKPTTHLTIYNSNNSSNSNVLTNKLGWSIGNMCVKLTYFVAHKFMVNVIDI